MRTASLNKNNIDVKTPMWLKKWLREEYGKYYDPCPFKWKPGSRRKDGLTSDWKKLNYVNPPFKDTKAWLTKGVEQRDKGNTSVFLVPFRATSKYFRDIVLPFARKVRVLAGKITFEGFSGGLPVPLCLVEFKGEDQGLPAEGHTAAIEWWTHAKAV